MSTRANWFLDELVELDEDAPAPSVSKVGTPFDLRDPATLMDEINRLFAAETELYDHGIKCAIKQEPPNDFDVTCSVCPMRHTGEEDPVRLLCELSVEQEQVKTAWKIATALGQPGLSLPGS